VQATLKLCTWKVIPGFRTRVRLIKQVVTIKKPSHSGKWSYLKYRLVMALDKPSNYHLHAYLHELNYSQLKRIVSIISSVTMHKYPPAYVADVIELATTFCCS